ASGPGRRTCRGLTTSLTRTGSALAAGQLFAQRSERLVRGEGAARLLAGRRLRGTATRWSRGARRLRLGSAGRLHLPGVRFPPGTRLGVLPLPLLAFLLVPGQPLAGLRVEALRVLVVAVLVVLGGHAVEGGVEVLLALDEALVRLLERQRDPPALQVDVDDLDHDLGANLHHLLRDLDVPLGELGDVHQALDAV